MAAPEISKPTPEPTREPAEAVRNTAPSLDRPGSSDGAVKVGTGGLGHDAADRDHDTQNTVDSPGARLPHEHDQSLGEVDSQPREVIKQAKRDLDAGMVDTDMWATPGLDAARREQLVPTPDKKP